MLHLVRRFFGALGGSAPNVVDEVWAESHLQDGEIRIWRRMANHDRRHAIEVARRFAARSQRSRDEMAAALLHDVGKVLSDLSVLERVAATALGGRTRRWRAYRDHERIGAEMCRRAGSSQRTLTVLIDTSDSAARDLRTADDV